MPFALCLPYGTNKGAQTGRSGAYIYRMSFFLNNDIAHRRLFFWCDFLLLLNYFGLLFY
jgi:hypothetical protein